MMNRESVAIGRAETPTSRWRTRRAIVAACAQPLGRIEMAVLTLVGAVAAFLRLRNLDYNTAFVDETINVLIARWWHQRAPDIVSGHFISWHAGWYLFPWIAAVGEHWGGIPGIRAVCGILGLVTIAAVFGYTRILFGNVAGIGAATIFALLAPAIFAGRVAFREAGTIAFLAVSLWLYARALTTNQRRAWLGAALAFFAAFLCKHPIAILAPPLAVGAAMANERALRWYAVALSLLCAGYVLCYWGPWWEMMAFLRTTDIARAPRSELLHLYVTGRLDFWILLALATVGAVRTHGRLAYIAWGMIGIAAVFATVNVVQHTDYLTYKQATYPLLFLVPLAAHAVAALAASRLPSRRPVVAIAFASVALTTGFAGRDWHWTSDDIGARWPNDQLVQTYLRGWGGRSAHVLTDDQTLIYYLWNWYEPSNITTAFFFQYRGLSGAAAYAAAIRDGYFDFVTFSGARAQAYDELHAAIDSLLPARYARAITANDPVQGGQIAIWRRVRPEVDRGASVGGDGIELFAPVAGSIVDRTGPIHVSGRASLAGAPGYAVLDVYTNRWYPQGKPIDVDPMTGNFGGDVWLGGGGADRCHHLIRVRVYDFHWRPLGVAAVSDVGRLDSATMAGC